MRTITRMILVLAVFWTGPAAAQRLVYMGLDPSSHVLTGRAAEFTVNVVQWASGGLPDPAIGYTGASPLFVDILLANVGFTDRTEIAIEDLDTADLSASKSPLLNLPM